MKNYGDGNRWWCYALFAMDIIIIVLPCNVALFCLIMRSLGVPEQLYMWHSTKTSFLWVRRENAPFLLFTFFGIYVYFLSSVMMYSCVWLHIDVFDIAPFFFSIRHFDVIQRARAVVFSSKCRFVLLFYFSLFLTWWKDV